MSLTAYIKSMYKTILPVIIFQIMQFIRGINLDIFFISYLTDVLTFHLSFSVRLSFNLYSNFEISLVFSFRLYLILTEDLIFQSKLF